jgi:hypothetical protein
MHQAKGVEAGLASARWGIGFLRNVLGRLSDGRSRRPIQCQQPSTTYGRKSCRRRHYGSKSGTKQAHPAIVTQLLDCKDDAAALDAALQKQFQEFIATALTPSCRSISIWLVTPSRTVEGEYECRRPMRKSTSGSGVRKGWRCYGGRRRFQMQRWRVERMAATRISGWKRLARR